MGGTKAEYFRSRGFLPEVPALLERALLEVARDGKVVDHEATPWGDKYHVWGRVQAPDGNAVSLATVWMVRHEEPPILITAYPQQSPFP